MSTENLNVLNVAVTSNPVSVRAWGSQDLNNKAAVSCCCLYLFTKNERNYLISNIQIITRTVQQQKCQCLQQLMH